MIRLIPFFFLASLSLQASNPPNIIFIFIDDLGWKDLGCYGNDFVETPRIDRLAAEGIRFTDAYAAGAVCSPTRCAVQSGQNQARIGITAHLPGHWRPFERVITPPTRMALPLDIVTVAETLKECGYTTGYVGKWHLGDTHGFGPQLQGYDFTAVLSGTHLPGMYRLSGGDDGKPEKGQYRTEFEAEQSIAFITKNQDRPFFLMLSPYAVHIPLGAMSDKVEKYHDKAARQEISLPHPVYAAMIEHVDDMVGSIVDAVDALGLAQDTLIVFTSDNGGLYQRYDYREEADDLVASQVPLRGEKGSLFEGGIRIPLIIKYPPVVEAGTLSREPVISYDYYPTFVDFAGGELPGCQTIDGLSLKPVLQDPGAQLKRNALYWHYPHYHHDRPASSIRMRDWKLIEYLDNTAEFELYNLAEDIGETENRIDRNPEMAEMLKTRLAEWRLEVIAPMPLPNPAYDPSRAHEWWSRRSLKPVDSDSRKPFPHTEKEIRVNP